MFFGKSFRLRFLMTLGVAAVLLALGATSVYALPQTTSDIDGNPSDWTGGTGGAAVCFTDEGLVDDETNPERADITQFCAHISPGGLFLTLNWDDTRPQGGGTAAVVKIDVTGDQLPDFIVGNTIDVVNPGAQLTARGMEISSCDDTACGATTPVCSERTTPGQCTGAIEAFGDTFPDPFANPARTTCAGAGCATTDAFVEMYIPWALLGGTAPSAFVFMTYQSSPSATSAAINDASNDVTGGGITCTATACALAGPTAISLSSVMVADQDLSIPFVTALTLLALISVSFYFWGAGRRAHA